MEGDQLATLVPLAPWPLRQMPEVPTGNHALAYSANSIRWRTWQSGGLAKQRGSNMMRAKIARGSNSEVEPPEPLEPLGRLAKCRQRARSAAWSSFILADNASPRFATASVLPAPPSWPVRTRTLNDRVRICSVTNYTTGQYVVHASRDAAGRRRPALRECGRAIKTRRRLGEALLTVGR
jgi:hypothetical protein